MLVLTQQLNTLSNTQSFVQFTFFLPVNNHFSAVANTTPPYNGPIEDRPGRGRSSGLKRLMHHAYGRRAIVRPWLFDAEVLEVGIEVGGAGGCEELGDGELEGVGEFL